MKPINETAVQTPKELLNELQSLVVDAEKMAATSISEHTAEAIVALRARFDAASQRMTELCASAKQKVVAGAKCTDEAIRANPYQSLAIAAGAGLLLGVILGRRSK
jgi:ElaB/YqjD/DUF883 family membrane-anchored ribosome-binding protein